MIHSQPSVQPAYMLHAQNMASMTKSIERLSTGLRIQGGADDASGLTVSERLRSQIRGLNRAFANVQDAVSMSQTADGALRETQDMLLRMRELSVQAQNDALTQGDRLEIQKEVDQLLNEIDRIAATTEFNQKNLLDGSSSSRVTTSPPTLKAYQVDNSFDPLGQGNYSLKILPSSYGQIQKLASNTLQIASEERLARGDEALGDTSVFAEFLGFGEVELEVQADGLGVKVQASSSDSIQSFAARIENTLRRDVKAGGLGLSSARAAYNAKTGQLEIHSGVAGESGRLDFFGPEFFTDALGLRETVKAEDPSYHVIAQQQGQVTGADLSKGGTASPIPGLRLEFPPPMPALAEVELITLGLGNEPLIISITSTNTNSGYLPQQAGQYTSAADAETAVVIIEPNENLTFADVVQELQTQIAATAPNMNLNISIVGNQVFFVSPETGESAFLNITTNKAAASLFSSSLTPPTSYNVVGTGGGDGRMLGNQNLAGGLEVTVPFQFRFFDQDGNTATTPLFPVGILPYQDLVDQTNASLAASGLKLSVGDRLGNQTFQIYTTEIGSDTMFQMDIHVPEKRISIPSDASFTAVDNNRANVGTATQSDEANILIPAGNYTLNDIEDMINSQVRAIPAGQRPRITAKFRDDYDGQNSSGTTFRNNVVYREGAGDFMLALQDDARGSASRISIYNINATAASVFGLTTSGSSGSGGTTPQLTAPSRISGASQLTPEAFQFRIVDGSGQETLIPFPAGANLSGVSEFGGTDLVSHLNANMGTARVTASYVNTTFVNGGTAGLTGGALSANPLAFPLDLSFRESYTGFNQTVNVTIPAGTVLSTFDFSTIDLSPTALTLQNLGGQLRINPSPLAGTLGGYSMRLTANHPAPQLNDVNEVLGFNVRSRLRLTSQLSGTGTQFLAEITGPTPANATAIGGMMGLSGSYGTFLGVDGFGTLSPAGPGATNPTRPSGNNDVYHDPGEVPNWTDANYTQHGRFTPAGYSVNRNVQSAPGGAAGLTLGAHSILSRLGLAAHQDSQTAEFHNSDTISFKATRGTAGTNAFIKVEPVPITLTRDSSNDQFNVLLSGGSVITVSLTKPLPPDGVVVGKTYNEIDQSLKEKLTPFGIVYELDRDQGTIRLRSRDVGKNARLGVTTRLDDAGLPKDFHFFYGTGNDEFELKMVQSRQTYQVGANQNQRLDIGLGAMSSSALGIGGLHLGNIHLATKALGKLDYASDQVNTLRAKIGAFQNRLQSTSDNLIRAQLDATATESRIRDADTATETVNVAKKNLSTDLSTQMIRRIPEMTKRLWSQLLMSSGPQ